MSSTWMPAMRDRRTPILLLLGALMLSAFALWGCPRHHLRGVLGEDPGPEVDGLPRRTRLFGVHLQSPQAIDEDYLEELRGIGLRSLCLENDAGEQVWWWVTSSIWWDRWEEDEVYRDAVLDGLAYARSVGLKVGLLIEPHSPPGVLRRRYAEAAVPDDPCLRDGGCDEEEAACLAHCGEACELPQNVPVPFAPSSPFWREAEAHQEAVVRALEERGLIGDPIVLLTVLNSPTVNLDAYRCRLLRAPILEERGRWEERYEEAWPEDPSSIPEAQLDDFMRSELTRLEVRLVERLRSLTGRRIPISIEYYAYPISEAAVVWDRRVNGLSRDELRSFCRSTSAGGVLALDVSETIYRPETDLSEMAAAIPEVCRSENRLIATTLIAVDPPDHGTTGTVDRAHLRRWFRALIPEDPRQPSDLIGLSLYCWNCYCWTREAECVYPQVFHLRESERADLEAIAEVFNEALGPSARSCF